MPPDLAPYLLAGVWSAGDLSLRDRALQAAHEAIGQDEGPTLWAYLLTAAARQGELRPIFETLLARCAEAGVDAVPYARGLARVLVRGGPEAAGGAREIVLDLAQDPAMINDQVMAHLFAALKEDDSDGR